MFCSSSCFRALALALLLVALSAAEALAHCFVGPRFLPATLATDDPCVADELSLPTVQWSKTGDVPQATEWDISAELSKRITEDLGISIGDTWSQIHQPGGFTQAGFSNLETTLQYQLLKDGPHELALLLGLIVDWGGTGAVNSGFADRWSTLTPTLWTLTVFIVLDVWGIGLGGVWAILVRAVTIIGVGFIATWAMTSNFTASFFLVLWRPFHVGQTVEILPENLKGRVVDRNLMFTTLSEDNGRVLQIPNSLFFQKIFRVSDDQKTSLTLHKDG